MKQFLLLVIVVSTFGCATMKPAQLPNVSSSNSGLITQDLRQQEESETEFLSLWATSCKYGIQRLGDEWTSPKKVDYLSSLISSELPKKEALTVNNFNTYFNMQHQLREGNIYRGPIWELVECDKNTDEFTSYSAEENPEKKSIIIGTLKGTLDGISFSERMAIFPKCPDGVPECHPFDAQANSVRNIVIELSRRIVDQNKQLTR